MRWTAAFASSSRFGLHSRLDTLNRLYHLTFRLQQDQPHDVALVIDQQEEEGRQLDGPVDIAVHELQGLTGFCCPPCRGPIARARAARTSHRSEQTHASRCPLLRQAGALPLALIPNDKIRNQLQGK